MYRTVFLTVAVTIIAVIGFLNHDAYATTSTWTGLGDGKNWSDPNNWDAHQIPLDNDTILIGNNLVKSKVHLDISFVLNGTISISQGSFLIVDSHAKLTTSPLSKIVENGVLAIRKEGSITNFGIISNPVGTPSRSINNAGIIVNYGGILSGTVNNTGTINNSGQIGTATYHSGGRTSHFFYHGNFINSGTVLNSGGIVGACNTRGSVKDSCIGGINADIINTGTINNLGGIRTNNITNPGIINNICFGGIAGGTLVDANDGNNGLIWGFFISGNPLNQIAC